MKTKRNMYRKYRPPQDVVFLDPTTKIKSLAYSEPFPYLVFILIRHLWSIVMFVDANQYWY